MERAAMSGRGVRAAAAPTLGAVACLAVASAALVGCVPGDVSLEGKSCPCAQGWRCDESRDVCVRGDATDGGGMDGSADAGMDAGVRDGGDATDGGPDDAGGDDAGSRDAGGGDAGTVDGSADAGMDAGVDAGMDAGVDAGMDAGPPDDTACDDTLSAAWRCEDFEGASLSGWGVREIDGTVERVTSIAYRGEGALRATTTATGGRAVLDSNPIPDVTSGDLYLRAYYYVPSDAPLRHINMLYAGTAEEPYVGISFGLRDLTGEPAVWAGTASTPLRASGVETPRDRWFCVQMHIAVADTGGSVDLSVDGALVGSWTDLDTLGPTGYGDFSIGIEWSSSEQMPTTIYVDEAAVSGSPLPCD